MFKNMKINAKLILSLLLIGLLPMAIMTFVSIRSSSDAIEKEAVNKLEAVRDIKSKQIAYYFTFKKELMTDVKDNLRFTKGIPEFTEVFKYGLNSPEYKAVLNKRQKGLKTFMDVNGFYDIIFIDTKGNVIYTVSKKSDLGENLVSGSLKNTSLAKVFNKGKEKVSFADYQWYAPSNDVASFISVPINNNGQFVGVAAFKMPLGQINDIMQERSGMGKTGETFLVGEDMRMRSNSFRDPKGHSVKASFTGSVEKNGIDTEASGEALAGKTGTKIILDYKGNEVISSYAPINALGAKWALLSEIDLAEVQEPSNALMNTLLIIMGVLAIVIVIIAIFFARSITSGIKNIIAQIGIIIENIVDGKLDARGDADDVGIDFKGIIININELIDAFVGPINVTAEYVDRISKGDIPPKITDEYKGDFNEIKNNLNQAIDVMNGLLEETNTLIIATKEGKLDRRGDSSKFIGGWAELIGGVNELIDAFVGPINVTAEYVDRIAKGDIPPKITEEYKGDFNEIKNNLNQAIDVMNGLLEETNTLIIATKEGKLDRRGDSSKFIGGWAELIISINELIDAFVGPINVTAEYVDRIAKGDIPPKITDDYQGDFNEIKNNLNQAIDALNGFVDDMDHMSKEHDAGDIDVEINEDDFTGCYKDMARGVNKMVFGHIAVKKKAMACIKAFGEGNFDAELEKFPGKKAFINDTIEKLRENLKNVSQEFNELIDASRQGRLDTRGDTQNFSGGWEDMIDGINQLLDILLAPVNEASEVLEIMAGGNLTPRMIGSYQGDNQKLKNSINSLGDSLSSAIQQVVESASSASSASMDIATSAESLAAASQEQSSQSDEVASAVEEMSRTVTENAMNASQTSEVAAKNGEIAREGGGVVDQTVGKMRDIAHVVQQSAENIEKLGESSKEIGEIISVIDDIADQTNLLALNAAIEAARAGEQGRGFAVVADEVRKLAERTTEATKQIATMIKGIQSETQEAVVAMKQGSHEVSTGIELADQAGNALEQIVQSSQQVLDMINQIAAASEQQSSTSEQISHNMTSISGVTAESAKRIEGIAHSSEDMNKLTDHLLDLMNQFKVDNGNGMNRTVVEKIGVRDNKQLELSAINNQ